jgi:hypothetical protein
MAGALLIAPLVVAAQAIPANAATGKLLVTTWGRAGHAVTSSITAISASATFSAPPVSGDSGRTLSLPDGSYYVLAAIQDSTSETLAAGYVTVSGAATAKLTLNAKGGHRVKVTLNGKAVTGQVDARICAGAGFAQSQLAGVPGSVYVVPSTSRALSFAYLAQSQNVTVSGLTAYGIPSSPGGAWTTSHLAKVSLTVRAGESAASSIASALQAQSPNGPGNCQWDIGGLVKQAAPPYSYTELVSPGYWDMRTDDWAQAGSSGVQDDIGGYDIMRHVLAGHSYSYTYESAAWGIAGPDTIGDHLPTAGNRSIALIAPLITDPGGNGTEGFDTRNAVALSLSGHTIAKSTQVGEFWAGIKSAGWYTLTDDVTRDYSDFPGLRVPGSLLTPQVTLSWHFYASPAQAAQIAPAFWASFVPAGLNSSNQAKPDTTTKAYAVS